MAKYKYKKLEADRLLWEELRKMFGNLPCNVRFEHKDDSGYWYTFELVNDSRRQTIRINP